MLLDALLEISDSDPLLQYYVDSTTHEIILSFLGKVQMEVTCSIARKVSCGGKIKSLQSFIWKDR